VHADEKLTAFLELEADRFTKFCGRWFRFCDEYQESLRCYMTTVYFNLPPEVRLICLTQALEAFHQHRFNPRSDSDEAKFVNRGNANFKIKGGLGTYTIPTRSRQIKWHPLPTRRPANRYCLDLPSRSYAPLARHFFLPRCTRNSVGDWRKTRLNIRLNCVSD
jgi:hypothetical protein